METALIRVQGDILWAMDRQRVVVLVMLDLSSAFDAIDHQVLLRRLTDDLSISDTAHRWFESYLEDRSQSVTAGDGCSDPQAVHFGVSQGSVLGPKLFSIYMSAPWGDIIKRYDYEDHFLL